MKVMSFSSGKGGVGKTTLVSNLGCLWAKSGEKVLLVDGDWSLGKLGIAFGMNPKSTVEGVLKGEIPITDAVVAVNENLSILASPTGVIGLEELSEGMRHQLFFELEGLSQAYDRVVIDHSSGIHWSVLQFAGASHQHVIVTTPEPTSYTDAYAIMKLLHRRFGIRDFCLLVTFAHNQGETRAIVDRFMDVVYANLDVRVTLLDTLPWEPQLAESVRRRQPYVTRFPHSPLTARLRHLATELDRMPLSIGHGLRFSSQERQSERETCQPE